mmetsp:Transcript_25876/g.54631  ORF Transcript_25876/g.54631 Transcript_25876/m.54631 type:complete len:229 (+) Transcript_25876:666-1352(+)
MVSRRQSNPICSCFPMSCWVIRAKTPPWTLDGELAGLLEAPMSPPSSCSSPEDALASRVCKRFRAFFHREFFSADLSSSSSLMRRSRSSSKAASRCLAQARSARSLRTSRQLAARSRHCCRSAEACSRRSAAVRRCAARRRSLAASTSSRQSATQEGGNVFTNWKETPVAVWAKRGLPLSSPLRRDKEGRTRVPARFSSGTLLLARGQKMPGVSAGNSGAALGTEAAC